MSDDESTWIGFELDPSAFEGARQIDALSRDEWLLEGYYLAMPVRILIDGIDLLPKGRRKPLIFLARHGVKLLESLPDERRNVLNLPGGDSLLFEMVDSDRIRVSLRGTEISAQTEYKRLAQAWNRFADSVRAAILAEFPQFAKHPQLGRWFSGGEAS